MRHKKAFQKLSRTSAHRRALLRNLATALVLKDSVRTTAVKAKELKRIADRLVTWGKQGTLHARRQAMRYLFAVSREETGNVQKLSAVHRLFTEVAPRFQERRGGYTCVVKIGKRVGDRTPMAIIQFVEAAASEKAPKARTRRTKKQGKAEAAR